MSADHPFRRFCRRVPHHRPRPGRSRAGHRYAQGTRPSETSPADVSHVNAHATGTPVGDAAEAQAIGKVFGDRITVTAPKAALGHLFGAAGAAEAIIPILSVEQGVIPPTRNLAGTALDPQIAFDVATTKREEPQRAAVTNSFGFGGQNVSLVITGA